MRICSGNNWVKFIFTAVLLSLLVACAINPVTGKRELMLLSEADEIQLGKNTDAEIVSTYGVYDDADLSAYISDLGMRLAKLSHRPNLPYEFKVMDTPVINAFAVPGGYVYITRGILAFLNNEAELAGVMGHEIGHITARHSAKQYSKAQLTQLGLGLGMMLSESFRKYAGLAQFGVGLLFLKFSRDNERQSDELGVEYSTKAGYDARQMANFFETLERMQPSGGSSGLPEWFSTHPNPADRVVKVKQLARQWQQKVGKKKFIVARNRYLKKINGLVFGEDPRQGYTESGIFYHPSLRFQFPVPAEWKLNNTASQVQMMSPDKKAAIIFTLKTNTTPGAVATQFAEGSKAVVTTRKNLRVNGLPAVKMVSEIATNEGQLRVMSYFIKKGNDVFVFHGFSDAASFTNYESNFSRTMGQFRKLKDPAKINVKPDRVRIKKAVKGGTLKEVLLAFGVAKDRLEKMALLNGMELTDRIAPNTLIKVVEKGRK